MCNTINPILKDAVERYMKSEKAPRLSTVCAILGIENKKGETKDIEVGDTIEFELKNGEPMEAIAVKREDDGMLFCCLNCLEEEREMNKKSTNEGGYLHSDLRKYMVREVLDLFPDYIRELMVPFKHGDLVRIPTEEEIFGENKYGNEEPGIKKQWEPMKKAMYRVASDRKEEYTKWYWLQNAIKDTASYFAAVDSGGDASIYYASYAFGVRPVFKIAI